MAGTTAHHGRVGVSESHGGLFFSNVQSSLFKCFEFERAVGQCFPEHAGLVPPRPQYTQTQKQEKTAWSGKKGLIQVASCDTASPQGTGRWRRKSTAVLSATGVGSLSALACSLSAACSAVRAQRPGPGPRGQSVVQSKAGWQGVQKCRAVAKIEACCLSRCARW